MVLVRMIRDNPFFAGLNDRQIGYIASAAHEINVDTGYKFFCEGTELDTFYYLKEGSVDITIGIPDHKIEHSFVKQITRTMEMEEIPVSVVGEGEIFGWSAIIPPHQSTANAVAATPCKVIAVACTKIRPFMEEDRDFAYKMAIKAAQTVRNRLRDRRIESLAFS